MVPSQAFPPPPWKPGRDLLQLQRSLTAPLNRILMVLLLHTVYLRRAPSTQYKLRRAQQSSKQCTRHSIISTEGFFPPIASDFWINIPCDTLHLVLNILGLVWTKYAYANMWELVWGKTCLFWIIRFSGLFEKHVYLFDTLQMSTKHLLADNRVTANDCY